MDQHNNSNWTGRFVRNETSRHWNPRNHNIVSPMEAKRDNILGWLLVVVFGVTIAAMLAFSI